MIGRAAFASLSAVVALCSACPSFEDPMIPVRNDDAGSGADDAAIDGDAATGTKDAGTTPLAPIASLAHGMGEHHTCVRREDGTATCWGDNTEGQLARSEAMLLRPAPLVGVDGVEEITVGAHHTCVRSGGRVRCFGANDRRQLGSGSTAAFERTPVMVPELDDATAISAGFGYTCALRTGGVISCWGSMRIGSGGEPVPSDVGPFPARPVAISTGAEAAAALLDDGTVWTWGRGGCNRLGIGTTVDHAEPVHLAQLPPARVIQVAMGDLHGCVLLESGSVYCWGCSGTGQVGTGTTTEAEDAINPPVSVLEDAVSIDASYRNSCAVMRDRSTQCWGANDVGVAGNGEQLPSRNVVMPEPVRGLGGVVELELYWQHACARLDNGRGVACWGYNERGQIGDGAKINAPYPTVVLR